MRKTISGSPSRWAGLLRAGLAALAVAGPMVAAPQAASAEGLVVTSGAPVSAAAPDTRCSVIPAL